MTFVAWTFYTIACNRCGVAYVVEDEATGDDVELTICDTTDGADALASQLQGEGWIAVGGGARHICPRCAPVEQAAAMDRLAIESTHDELPFEGGTP